MGNEDERCVLYPDTFYFQILWLNTYTEHFKRIQDMVLQLVQMRDFLEQAVVRSF